MSNMKNTHKKQGIEVLYYGGARELGVNRCMGISIITGAI